MRVTARDPKGEKRPIDEQQKAKAISRWENEGGAKAKAPERPRSMIDIATGEAGGREITPEAQEKDPAAVKRGRPGGFKGRVFLKAPPQPARCKKSFGAWQTEGTSRIVDTCNIARNALIGSAIGKE